MKRNIVLSSQCGVEQLVARWAHNPKVAGSSPAPATKTKAFRKRRAFFFVEFSNQSLDEKLYELIEASIP